MNGRGRVDGAVAVGLGLIVLGALLALDNLDVVDTAALLAGWWPVALVVAGAWWAIGGSWVTGSFVAAVGVLMLGITQDVVDAGLGNLVFPAFLLIVGGALLQAGMRVRAARLSLEALPRGFGGDGDPEGPAATALFGDARLVVTDDGTDRDRVVVSGTAVFGDVRIEVPAGWRVEDRTSRVFGDVHVPVNQPDYPESPTVELHGVVVFGDLSVDYLDLAEDVR